MTSENPSLRVFHCPGTTSENTAEALADYQRALRAAPLAVETRRTYYSKVRGYLTWLAAAGVDGDPLTQPRRAGLARYATTAPTWSPWPDAQPRHHQHHPGRDRRLLHPHAASARPAADRLDLPQPKAPAPWTPKTRAAVAARHRHATLSPRDRVLALLPIYAGLRVSETVALDTDRRAVCPPAKA